MIQSENSCAFFSKNNYFSHDVEFLVLTAVCRLHCQRHDTVEVLFVFNTTDTAEVLFVFNTTDTVEVLFVFNTTDTVEVLFVFNTTDTAELLFVL